MGSTFRLNFDFGFLNFDYWDLFEIWFLVLGIFMSFIIHVILVKSVNHLF